MQFVSHLRTLSVLGGVEKDENERFLNYVGARTRATFDTRSVLGFLSLILITTIGLVVCTWSNEYERSRTLTSDRDLDRSRKSKSLRVGSDAQYVLSLLEDEETDARKCMDPDETQRGICLTKTGEGLYHVTTGHRGTTFGGGVIEGRASEGEYSSKVRTTTQGSA
ncbi:unnamed protein product [Chondrus crispus]|uniref:Uncharacterized protein n=1 Tax=Chondrus crispus TaxID=2769 RepID=R7QME2_CHOCR|nr:unnamed protein product [Chondrus crispus]CDF39269.1 unnamed protein product [Chondrus crispus]|eukprot:XP_005719180.1 unnamed protein product [Chondrus crispus]